LDRSDGFADGQEDFLAGKKKSLRRYELSESYREGYDEGYRCAKQDEFSEEE
jgi:hypothetical protein